MGCAPSVAKQQAADVSPIAPPADQAAVGTLLPQRRIKSGMMQPKEAPRATKTVTEEAAQKRPETAEDELDVQCPEVPEEAHAAATKIQRAFRRRAAAAGGAQATEGEGQCSSPAPLPILKAARTKSSDQHVDFVVEERDTPYESRPEVKRCRLRKGTPWAPKPSVARLWLDERREELGKCGAWCEACYSVIDIEEEDDEI